MQIEEEMIQTPDGRLWRSPAIPTIPVLRGTVPPWAPEGVRVERIKCDYQCPKSERDHPG